MRRERAFVFILMEISFIVHRARGAHHQQQHYWIEHGARSIFEERTNWGSAAATATAGHANDGKL